MGVLQKWQSQNEADSVRSSAAASEDEDAAPEAARRGAPGLGGSGSHAAGILKDASRQFAEEVKTKAPWHKR
eukprot:2867061-Alexandrium_andersonii.AAC.1